MIVRKISLLIAFLSLFCSAFSKPDREFRLKIRDRSKEYFITSSVVQDRKKVAAEKFGFVKSNPDNSLALQKAINHCGPDSTCDIILPSGIFHFKSPVILNNARLVGSTVSKTVFVIDEDFKFDVKLSSPKKSAFIYNVNCIRKYNEETANSVNIENIDFISNAEASTKYTGTVILLANVKNGLISNCSFFAKKNTSAIANTLIDLYSCVKNVKIVNCRITNLNEKDYGGGMWIRNQTADGANKLNATENIILENVIFKQAASDEALSIFGSGGLTKNITVNKCTFQGLITKVPHSVLLSVLPLNGSYGGQYAGVDKVKILNSTFIDSCYRNYILRVGGNSSKDRDNLCDNITISGNKFYSYSKVNSEKSSIIMAVKNRGENVIAINNEISSNNSVFVGIRGFDRVTGNTITSNNVAIGILESGFVEGNNIRVKGVGVQRSKSILKNKITIIK